MSVALHCCLISCHPLCMSLSSQLPALGNLLLSQWPKIADTQTHTPRHTHVRIISTTESSYFQLVQLRGCVRSRMPAETKGKGGKQLIGTTDNIIFTWITSKKIKYNVVPVTLCWDSVRELFLHALLCLGDLWGNPGSERCFTLKDIAYHHRPMDKIKVQKTHKKTQKQVFSCFFVFSWFF